MFESKPMTAPSPKPQNSVAKRAVVAALIAAVLAVSAAPTSAANNSAYLRIPHKAAGSTQSISLEVNKSILVDLPTNAGEVIASQPSVATVVMRTKTRAIIQGVANGNTNIFFLDPAGNNIALLDLRVTASRSSVGDSLEAAIARNVPGSRIRVESVETEDGSARVVLTGTARSQDDVNKAVALANQFANGEANVGNIITVEGSQQVRLQVTVAEVARDTVKQLGINLNGSVTIGNVTLGMQSIPSNGGASGVTNTNGFTASGSAGPVTLTAALRALERRGALRTLAEPTLTAISGQPATFLAGGEFPVPSAVSAGEVTYTFKEFGVKLNFTPTIKSNGLIGLVVDTSVSELTTEGGFSVGGVTIPATKNRQATTSVEMYEGQTLAIAGMLQDVIRQQVSTLR